MIDKKDDQFSDKKQSSA